MPPQDPTLDYAREVLRQEANAISACEPLLGPDFLAAVELVLACRGHAVTTGMGKSGIIAQKLSATLASTGTPSFYLHPAEAIHGDLGRIRRDDVLIALSNSGGTAEVRRLIPSVTRIGAPIVAVTAKPDSPLAQHATCLLQLPSTPEACPIGLAPTASTTAQLALCDALAMAVSKRRNFTKEDFAAFHPGGALGRSLIKVGDIMRPATECPPAPLHQTTRDALMNAGGAGRRPGALPVVDPQGALRGILTDGDVRRHTLTDPNFLDLPLEQVMTPGPKSKITSDQLAAAAWRTMRDHNFDELPVTDPQGQYVGLLDVQDLLEAGITQPD